ncbi:MAG: exopolysaccharide Pel transporter PelG [Planctomycetota bacterium]
MAGIGFELRRLVDDEPGFLSKLRGYACAGLISSGPWIMTMVSLAVMGLLRDKLASLDDFDNFRALVTYSFAFSLVTVGALQMSVTRRLADLLYNRQYSKVLPAFTATIAAVAVVQAATGLIATYLVGFDIATMIVWAALYTIVSLTWVALVWLTLIRQYDQIFIAYFLGMAVSWITVRFVATQFGLASALAAFTAGQALTLAILVRLIVRGTEAPEGRDWSILGVLKTHPGLAFVGIFYSAAIWVDKVVFWLCDGMGTHPAIRFHPLYDTCCFLAYVTVLPALAINLVHIETSFYERYRGYYASILSGLPLQEMERKRGEMIDNLREGAVRLVRIQGAISLLCVALAPWIIEILAMPATAVRVFQLACIGALFHVLLLITTLVLLYFDLRRAALLSCATFFVLNGFLAVSSLRVGVHTYGLGYALASLISLLLAFSLLGRGLRDLAFHTFTNQAKLLD